MTPHAWLRRLPGLRQAIRRRGQLPAPLAMGVLRGAGGAHSTAFFSLSGLLGHGGEASDAAEGAAGGLELRGYFASACPHCKHLAPAWKEAAAAYSGPVRFREIECADANWKPVPENAAVCKGIEGYPTLKLFRGDEEVA